MAAPARALVFFALGWALAGCPHNNPSDGGTPDAGPPGTDAGPGVDAGPVDAGLPLPLLHSTLVDAHFRVRDHMRASIEMQLTGEPFAQLLNYNLNNFNRQLSRTDQYLDPNTNQYVTDPLGYALAIESYEYSKQPMNQLSFESGAGLSLMYGPLINPGQVTGDAAYQLLANRFQLFATESFSGGSPGQRLIVSPPPIANPLNWYGWPGWWPQFAEFSSFDPTIHPAPGTVNTCTFKGSVGSFNYGGPANKGTLIANYECDYNSLNLPDRANQVSMTLDPGAMGYVVWKQGLWTINYWQTLQDKGGNGITQVDPLDVPYIGQPGNTVVGQYPDPNDPTGTRMLNGTPGVYLGDIPMEGWQGLTMIDEIDNKSALLLGSLLSSDGATLGGAPSISAAIAYSYDSPLFYFPASVAVTETSTATDAGTATKYFPKPTALAIADGTSQLGVLSGLAGGYGEAFAFTDRNNAIVGGSVEFLATFDGDPFPQDDGLADGENTLHDRALGVIKIALVDLDRLHFDPVNHVLVDTASVSGGTVTRGTHVTTMELAESILGLRNAYRGLNGTLQLYSNDTPDSPFPSALDSAPLTGASYSGTLANHLLALIQAQADFLSNKLVDANGAVANGYGLAAQAPDSSPTTLEAEAGAIRCLLDAYLATGNGNYRTKAVAVFADLRARFFMDDLRAFRTTVGNDGTMQYTPIRHGLLMGALRQYYKLWASDPSRAAEGAWVLAQIKRTNKLMVNGWNDRNQDDQVQYPAECLSADGGPSGLQLGERALTAELGNPGDMGDRDHDCVREISYVSLPASLAGEVDVSR